MMQLSEILGWARFDLALVTCLVSIAFIVKSYTSRRKNFPPGPYGLPIFGYLPMLVKDAHVELVNVGKKYGDIFSVQIGSETFVVLNSIVAAREVLSKPELLDRPDQSRYLVAPSQDPFFGNGQPWREHKKFALKLFRDLNAGKALEEQIKGILKNLIDDLHGYNGCPMDIRKMAFSSFIDVSSTISFGKHFDRKDPEKSVVDETISEVMELIESSMIIIFFPWLKTNGITRRVMKFDKILKMYTYVNETVRSWFEEQRKLPVEERKTSLSMYYLDEMSRSEKDKSTFSDKLAVDGMVALYGAGAETVRDSLVWTLYTMAVYKDVQRKVQSEIDHAVGKDNMPSYSDQKEMKYTQAVIMEMLRWQTIIPIGIRKVAADTKIRDYEVPKDTLVLVNHYAIHHDPKYWKDPDEFNPERFLSPDGQHILKNDSYLPFSYGKRSCVGEGIAWMELFLFLTGILQKFEIDLPDGDQPNFEGCGALSYQMKRHRLRFLPRHS